MMTVNLKTVTRFNMKASFIICVTFGGLIYYSSENPKTVPLKSKKFWLPHVKLWEIYNKINRSTENLRYVLMWPEQDQVWQCLDEEQHTFVEKKCSENDCYVTSGRNFLIDKARNISVIKIEGKMAAIRKNRILSNMYDRQWYNVFVGKQYDGVNLECETYVHLFDFIWTHLLHIDAVWRYVSIDLENHLTVKGEIDWSILSHYKSRNKSLGEYFQSENNSAWLVFKCYMKARKRHVVEVTKNGPAKYQLNIKVKENCGYRVCPAAKTEICFLIVM